MEEESEFGKGYSYCLGLFLCHADRDMSIYNGDYAIWFNAAGDHISEFKPLNERGHIFRERIMRLRIEKASKEAFIWAIGEAKDLLMEYDKSNGIDVIKAQWE